MPDRHKEAAIAYVKRVCREKGWDPTTLARKSGVAQTTITRPLNNPKHPHGFNSRTLAKIAAASKIPLPAELGGTGAGGAESASTSRGLAEDIANYQPVGQPRSDVYAYQLVDEIVDKLKLKPSREQRAKAFEKASDFFRELLKDYEPR